MAVDTSRLQKFYIAYYGRPADPEGLAYWATVLENNLSGNEVLMGAAFGNAAQAEFAAIYGASTSSATAFINKVYNNLFGRNVDSEGLAYWQGVYTQKVVVDGKDPAAVRAEMVMYIVDGAQGSDATIVSNKTTAAVSFTAALDTADEQVAFVNAVLASPGSNAGTSLLAAIGSTTTAEEITALVTAQVAAAVTEGNAALINEISLTATATNRTFSGSINADKFLGGTIGTEFKDGDTINGLAGDDTLQVRSFGLNGGTFTTTLNGVENVELTVRSATTLDMLLWSGVDTVTVTSASLDAAAVTLNNVAVGTNFALDNNQGSFSATFQATNATDDSVTISLGSGGATTVNVGLGGEDLESVVINASGQNTVNLTSAGAESFTLTGNGGLALTIANDSASTINASTFSGSGVAVTVSAATVLAFTGSDGNDTLTIRGLTSADTLDGGAGTDTLVLVEDLSVTSLSTQSGVSNFEALTINSLQSSLLTVDEVSFTTVNVHGGSSVSTLTFTDTGDGRTFNLYMNSAESAEFNYTGDAITSNVALRASGNVDLSSLKVSGANTVNITGAMSSVAYTITRSDVAPEAIGAVTITNGGSGDLAITTLYVSGSVSDLTLAATSQGSLAVTSLKKAASVLSTTEVGNLTLTANGASASVAVTNVNPLGSGLTSIDLNALAGGTVTVGDITVKDTEGTIAVGLETTQSGTIGAVGGGFELTVSGAATVSFDVNAGGSGIVYASSLSAFSGTVSNFDVTLSGRSSTVTGDIDVSAKSVGDVIVAITGVAGSAEIGTIDARSGIGSITVDVTTSGGFYIGAVSGDKIGNIYVSGAGSTNINFSTLQANSGIGNIDINVGAKASADMGAIDAKSGVGAVTITTGVSGVVTLAAISANTVGLLDINAGSHSDITLTSVAVHSGAGFAGVDLTAGYSAVINLGTVSNNVGASAASGIDVIGSIVATNADGQAEITLGTVSAGAGSFGEFDLSVGSGGVLTVGNIYAEVSAAAATRIDSIALTAASGATISLGTILVSTGNIGEIVISGSGTLANMAPIYASGIGTLTIATSRASADPAADDIDVAGTLGTLNLLTDGLSIQVSATTIGEINVTGSGTNLYLQSAGQTTVAGNIVVDGKSGTTIIDLGSATVGGILSVQGGSAVKIDMSGMSARPSVIELAAGSGLDVIQLVRGSAYESIVGGTGTVITGFGFSGSAKLDRLFVGGLSSDSIGLGSAAAIGGFSAQTYLDVLLVTATGANGGYGSAAASRDLFAMMTGTGLYDITDALSKMGAMGVSAGTTDTDASISSASNFYVLWFDEDSGTNLHLVTVNVSTGAAKIFTSDSIANGAVTVNQVAVFDDDIRTYSGTDLGAVFGLGNGV